ncbi:hypothetical protein S245_015776 [Arachis hypogaea]
MCVSHKTLSFWIKLYRFGSRTDDLPSPYFQSSFQFPNPYLNSFSPNQKRELKQETLASPPLPQGRPLSVALRHYHRRLVVRASSSFKNCSFFCLELGASVPGIHLLHRTPAAVRRALSHHRLRLVVADSSNPPSSSELCSSPGLCLRHDSAPLFSDCSEEKPISIPVSFLRVQRAEAQPRKKP